MIAKTFTSSLLLLSLLSVTATAQRLIPDSSFNMYGYQTQAAWGATKIMHFDDGSVVVGGMKGDSLALWKYRPNGSPDPSFGSNGLASIRIGSSVLGTLEVRTILQQRDKKIVVMGNAEKQLSIGGNDGLNAIVIARFQTNGTPDASFNTNGFIVDKPRAGYQYAPSCLSIDSTGPDDRFYVGSSAMVTGAWGLVDMWCISKYKNNGRPDSSFNSTGVLQGIGPDINPVVTGRVSLIHDLRVLPTGRLQVTGSHVGADSAWFFFRLKPNGNYDSTYGTNGRIYRRTNYMVPANALTSASILADGSSTLVTHNFYPIFGTTHDSMILYVARQNANGTPMTNYGTNGLLKLSYLGTGTQKLAFDSAGRMLLAWYRAYGTNSQRLHFKRFNPNGTIDTSFGGNGLGEVISEPMLNDFYYNRSALQDVDFTTDFKGLSVIGSRNNPALNSGFSLFRYKFVLPKLQTQGIATVKQLQANVFPIPATGTLYINAQEPIQSLTLINMLGQTVLTETAINKRLHSIATGSYPAGHYILQATGTNGGLLNKTIEIR